jgi:hypothetical protein
VGCLKALINSAVRVSVFALVLAAASAAPAMAKEPGAGASTPGPVDHQAIANEQSHLQTVSAGYSVQVAHDENLPLQFRRSDAPKGHNLLNLNF